MTAKKFINNILSGVALGIVAGLIPNAILGELFKALTPYSNVFETLHHVVASIQFTVPVIIGVLVAMQFHFNPLQTVTVGTAAFVGSGAAKFQGDAWVLTGIGDLINTMITAAIAVLLVMLIKDYLGSLTIILLPIIIGGFAGFLGLLLLPYVKLITTGLGNLIESFTYLQPLLMTTLISITFSLLIVSPISTVAISMAVGLTGIGSGAASLGVAASGWMLMVATLRVNKIGVPLAVVLGAMKMMMPNLLKNPVIAIPISMTAAVTGVFASILNIQGTPETGGFGMIGLVGPINALKFMDGPLVSNLLMLGFAYIIVPLIMAIFVHFISLKIGLYNKEVFVFEAGESEKNKKTS